MRDTSASTYAMSLFDRFQNDDVKVTISELLVATADSTDPLLDGSVNEVLAAMRQQFGLDVVFVSEIVDGRRIYRFVNAAGDTLGTRAGDSNPVEETYCQRVVDGRMPEMAPDVAALPDDLDVPDLPMPVGSYLSTPIVLKSGRTFGTLCCFSDKPQPSMREHDLQTLRLAAQLVARKLDLAKAMGVEEPPADWSLEPIVLYESKVWNLK